METFKSHENKKEEQPVFKIYEDKVEEKSSAVLRNAKDKKKIKDKQETATVFSEEPSEIETIRNSFPTSTTIYSNEKPTQKNQDNVLSVKDSPMSLEKTLMYSCSPKGELRNKKEYFQGESSFYDVDEYRGDIYNYLRATEVCVH